MAGVEPPVRDPEVSTPGPVELTTDEINIIRKSGGSASGFITLEDFRGMLDEPDGPPM